MRYRVIQPIRTKRGRVIMPGAVLDDLGKTQADEYLKDGYIAEYIEDDEPQKKKSKQRIADKAGGKAPEDVKNGDG